MATLIGWDYKARVSLKPTLLEGWILVAWDFLGAYLLRWLLNRFWLDLLGYSDSFTFLFCYMWWLSFIFYLFRLGLHCHIQFNLLQVKFCDLLSGLLILTQHLMRSTGWLFRSIQYLSFGFSEFLITLRCLLNLELQIRYIFITLWNFLFFFLFQINSSAN